MVAASTGDLALGALGALIALAAMADVLLTVFNYDGFTSIAGRFQRVLWSVIRTLAELLPERARGTALSVGSASLLPASVALWIGLEVTGFALMYTPGLASGAFKVTGPATIGTAFYLSAGAISSLTFGEIVPRAGLDRTLIDLETIVGLATFTLALGYVVAAFDALGKLENLHGRVRRHASDPERPSSILSRHFRGGEPSDLSSFLQALGDDLEDYDQGLRRYPVVYFFHPRRRERSIPHVFAILGRLLSLLRFGLPTDEPLRDNPYLVALLDGYSETLERLRRSFVGPDPIDVAEPVSLARFTELYPTGGEATVAAFRELESRTRESTGWPEDGEDAATAYERYREWLPFASRSEIVLQRVATALGYRSP